ncbi:MAG: potassium channel family protein [Nostocoides sp.]
MPGPLRKLLPHLRRAAIVVCALLAFYLVPVTSRDASASTRIAIGIVVLLALGAMVVMQLRSDDDRVGRLVMVLGVVIFVFAVVFYSLSTSSPGQFEGLNTRTDALYFTVVTLTTIGYGDIHPVGQAARVMVIAVIAFDLVFVTTLVSAITGQVRLRVADRTRPGSDRDLAGGEDTSIEEDRA